MRRNIRSHSYRNTSRTIYQKVRKTGRKHYRLFFCFVKVWPEINSIFIDICKHLHRNFTKSCFRISHRSGSVTVYRTKISMSIHKRISRRPFLRHINQRAINRTVSMRMILTHRIADNTCTFTVRFVRSVI